VRLEHRGTLGAMMATVSPRPDAAARERGGEPAASRFELRVGESEVAVADGDLAGPCVGSAPQERDRGQRDVVRGIAPEIRGVVSRHGRLSPRDGA